MGRASIVICSDGYFPVDKKKGGIALQLLGGRRSAGNLNRRISRCQGLLGVLPNCYKPEDYMRPITSRSIFWVFALASVAFTEKAGAASTYYIDESTAYAGSCSNNENLNVVSASLKTAMDARSFTGARYVNSSAISGDFTESCSPSFGVGGVHAGLDSIYGDSKSVVVFAGHGGAGFFYFQTPWWGQCYTQMSSNMRQGSCRLWMS